MDFRRSSAVIGFSRLKTIVAIVYQGIVGRGQTSGYAETALPARTWILMYLT